MRRVLVATIAFAIGATASAPAQSAPPNDTQHYGEIADPSIWPISAVGVVTVALFSRKMSCTGTLVGPKLVLTGNVRFLAGLNKGVPAVHADAKRLVVPKEFSPGPPTQESVINDWAVIVLSDAISIKPVPVRPTTRDELRVVDPASTVQIGYGRDRLYLPSIVRDCSVSESPDNRSFNHKCLTNFGYSVSDRINSDHCGNPADLSENGCARISKIREALLVE